MSTMESKTYDDLEIGSTGSFSKQLTEDDIIMFAASSGDVNPVHLDDEYAKASIFKERIAHGMWSAGLISACLATEMPGPGTVYLGQNLSFRLPVKLGDTLTVTLTVKEKLDEKKFLVIDCKVVNQDDKLVVLGEAQVMPPREKMTIDAPVLPKITIA